MVGMLTLQPKVTSMKAEVSVESKVDGSKSTKVIPMALEEFDAGDLSSVPEAHLSRVTVSAEFKRNISYNVITVSAMISKTVLPGTEQAFAQHAIANLDKTMARYADEVAGPELRHWQSNG